MNYAIILKFFIFSFFILFSTSVSSYCNYAFANTSSEKINISISNAVLSDEELKILRSKPLVIGYSHEHQPLSYTNDGSKPKGIIIDIFNAIAKEYGFEIKYKKIDELYEKLQTSKGSLNADIVLPTVNDYPLTFSNFTLTKPYLSLPLFIYTLTDTVDQEVFLSKPSSIAMYNYFFADIDKIAKDFPNKEFTIFSSHKDMFLAYNSGNVNALLATDTSLYFNQYIVYKTKQLTNNTYELAVYETSHFLNLHAFVSNSLENHSIYINIFDKIFTGLNQHIVNDIKLIESQKFYPELSIIDFLVQNYYTIIAIFIAFIFLVYSLVLLYKNKQKSQMISIANIDSTTGLLSKHKFFNDIEEKLKKATPDEYKYITVRFDNFPVINEMFSYEKGTQVIVAIAQMFLKAYEHKDVLICREKPINFSFFCATKTDLDIQELCENELNALVCEILAHDYDLKVSIGKYTIENPEDSTETISNRVRLAVKKGASNYQSTLTIYDREMQIAEKVSQDIVFRMKQALNHKEFFVVYQPKVDLQTMKILGAEALVRWKPVGHDPIYPDKFIPLFEENGFIAELDLFVFNEVCMFLQKHQHIFPLLKVSVNMSPVTLFSPQIRDNILRALTRYGIDSSKIIVELTESATLLDPDSIAFLLARLKSDGFEVSIDDFGSGLSSLNRLGTLDVNEIKLDKEFLDFDRSNIRKMFIVQDIVSMIKRLGIRVVCEGVETKDQALWLKDIGCNIGQGYFFAKPMQRDAFKNTLILPDKSQVLPSNKKAINNSKNNGRLYTFKDNAVKAYNPSLKPINSNKLAN